MDIGLLWAPCGQPIIIEQLTSGPEKLMGTDIASVFMVAIQILYN